MVRQGQEIAQANEGAPIRVVEVEYPRDWPIDALYANGQKQLALTGSAQSVA
jgi:hypothetical protein